MFLLQNLSQQSDVADLLGGFKPMDAQSICIPLYNEFKFLFSKAFSMKVVLILVFCFLLLLFRLCK